MRRITVWIMSTLSILVLLFSYRTSTNHADADAGASGSAAATAAGDSAAGPTAPTGTTLSAESTSSPSGTFTGTTVNTRYGPVQVQITVEAGRITAAQAVRYPNADRHDQQINSRAVPQLNSQVVEAQGSQIDMVSGATYSSAADIQSLQAALDEANL